jgi:hypothetical protein
MHIMYMGHICVRGKAYAVYCNATNYISCIQNLRGVYAGKRSINKYQLAESFGGKK